MLDLYMTKKDALWEFIKAKQYVRSSEIIMWGSENFYNCADRMKRTFVEEGRLRMLTDDEKVFRGFKTKEGVYEVINTQTT